VLVKFCYWIVLDTSTNLYSSECHTYESAAEGVDEREICEEQWDESARNWSAGVTHWTCTCSSDYRWWRRIDWTVHAQITCNGTITGSLLLFAWSICQIQINRYVVAVNKHCKTLLTTSQQKYPIPSWLKRYDFGKFLRVLKNNVLY